MPTGRTVRRGPGASRARWPWYTGAMQPTGDDPERGAPLGDEPEGPAAVAKDGMAPLINNTGADDTDDDDADASSG